MPGTPHAFTSHLEQAGSEISKPKIENAERPDAPSTDKLWGDLKKLLDEKRSPTKVENPDRVDDKAPLRRTETELPDFIKEFDIGELIKAAVEAYQGSEGNDNNETVESQSAEDSDEENERNSDAAADSPESDTEAGFEKSDSEEDNDQKDISPEEVDAMQKKAISEAFERIARGEKLTDAEKGNLGEMLMDQYYISRGYKPIHTPRVTDLSHKSGQGIDGVYEKTNQDGTKSYIIADAKVNSSKLNKGLADGTDQMSDQWIENRLDKAVGKEKADEIRDAYEDNPESISKEVYHFSYGDSEDGYSTADVSTVDEAGNQNKDKTVVQIFDKDGNETQGGTHR